MQDGVPMACMAACVWLAWYCSLPYTGYHTHRPMAWMAWYGGLCVAWTSLRDVMLLTCSLADVTLVYHSGPSPASLNTLL